MTQPCIKSGSPATQGSQLSTRPSRHNSPDRRWGQRPRPWSCRGSAPPPGCRRWTHGTCGRQPRQQPQWSTHSPCLVKLAYRWEQFTCRYTATQYRKKINAYTWVELTCEVHIVHFGYVDFTCWYSVTVEREWLHQDKVYLCTHSPCLVDKQVDFTCWYNVTTEKEWSCPGRVYLWSRQSLCMVMPAYIMSRIYLPVL